MITPQRMHIYIYIYIYIYMYAVVFDNGVLFLAQCVRECSRSCVRKWGAQRPRAGNPYFYSVSWASWAQQLLQQSPQVCNVVPGQHAEKEASAKKNSGLWPVHPHPGFRQVWGLHLSIEGGHAQNCGKNGFFRLLVWKFRWKGPKPGTWKNGKIYLCWRAPPHFCVFWWRAWISPKTGFWKPTQTFAETTENVVPNCRGSKTHFGALGSGTSHVRSGSNMVPKYFSLNWLFLSHSPSRRQGELFHFSCLFPSWAQVPFYSFHGCILFCNNNFNFSFVFCLIFVFLLVVFVCCWCLCFWFYFVIPFSLLTSVFLFFFPFSFFVFAFHFFFLLFVLSSSCFSPSLVFLSVAHPYLVLT